MAGHSFVVVILASYQSLRFGETCIQVSDGYRLSVIDRDMYYHHWHCPTGFLQDALTVFCLSSYLLISFKVQTVNDSLCLFLPSCGPFPFLHFVSVWIKWRLLWSHIDTLGWDCSGGMDPALYRFCLGALSRCFGGLVVLIFLWHYPPQVSSINIFLPFIGPFV